MQAQALHELTPGYALDALSADEEREYEAHLARCVRCRSELASLLEAATSLAYGVEAPAPPPQLRERIIERARAERPNVATLRPRWALPAAATAAVAVAATIALAIWASSLSSRLDRERSARAGQERVAEVLAAPDARPFTIQNDRGRLVVTPMGDAALVLNHLAPAPRGKTYEAWVVRGGKPRPAGTFQAGREVTAVALDELVPNGATVAVTEEKAGGVDAPTQTPFVTVST
jgi:anti-sigma-K factor RskA